MKKFLWILLLGVLGMLQQLAAQDSLYFNSTTIPDCSNCNGQASLIGAAGVEPYTYTWSHGATGNNLTDLCAGMYEVTMTDATAATYTGEVFVGTNANAGIDLSGIVVCSSAGQNNGSIELTTNDPNITFLWSTGSTTQNLNNLPPATYVVTVTNAHGCTQIGGWDIGNLDTPPEVTITTCGSTITIDTAGANNGFTILEWQVVGPVLIYNYPSTILNAEPGAYTVNIYTDCGWFQQNFQVGNDLQIIGQVTHGDCGLQTGAISVTVSGGTPPYSLEWNTGQTGSSLQNLSGGNYLVTVTDSLGCSQVADIQVLALGLNMDLDIACSGFVLASMQDGIIPFTYSFKTPNGDVFSYTHDQIPSSTWFEIIGNGQYTVTVVDGAGCAAVDSILAPDRITINLYRCDSTLYASISEGIPPFTVSWTDSNGSTAGINCPTCLNTTYDPAILSGQINFHVQDGSDYVCNAQYEISLDSAENCPALITGTIYRDDDGDCSKAVSETGLPHQFVQATATNGTNFFGTTDPSGDFQIAVEPGTWNVSAIPNNPFYSVCPSNILVNLTGIDTVTTLFGFEPQIFCPLMTVDMGAVRLRICENNLVVVNYCNQGTTLAENASVEITLPPSLSLSSSTAPILNQVGTQFYQFGIGNLQPGQCGQFSMQVFLDCNTFFGQTHCLEAHVLPDTNCLPPNPQWNGANVELLGTCESDSVRFILKNTGTGDMDEPLEYFIVEDQIILMNNPFQLPAGGQIEFAVPANGSTWYVAAEQVDGHPGMDAPSAIIEACIAGNGSFSTGFASQFPTNDADFSKDILCIVGESSYDPNEKLAFPVGFSEQHFIKPGDELEYTLHFQNTGNSAANKIVLRDSLSEYLDPLSIRPGASSHPYRFELEGNGVATFYFDNIMLPDSNANFNASQGFVHFRIRQRNGNQSGTKIENKASIYFDHNPAVVTNTVQHIVNEDFIVELSASQEASKPMASVQVYPNPMADYAVFELDEDFAASRLIVSDLFGRTMLQIPFTGRTARIDAAQLPIGMYLFKIVQYNGSVIGNGRIIKQ